ncbi:unnamed protein product, partial [Tenebrio molitor]
MNFHKFALLVQRRLIKKNRKSSLKEKSDFKTALKKFIDKLPLDIAEGVLEYKKLLFEELAKDEEHADYSKLKEATTKYLNQETIDHLRNNYKLIAKDEE